VETDRWARAAEPLRARLVRRITDAGLLRDPCWRSAFTQVPRHLFVPCFYRPIPGGGGYDRLAADDAGPQRRSRWLAGVYEDVPLVTRVDGGDMVSSSSQPSLMAGMLEALDAREGHTVLEIGTGPGYNAALLAHRLGADAVTTVDLDAGITGPAVGHLAACGFASRTAGGAGVAVVTADGAQGCRERAPFDRIVATCAMQSVPGAWLAQCAPRAVVLAPLAGGVIALRVTGAGRAEGRFLHTPAYFVPLRGPGAPQPPEPQAGVAGVRVRRSRTPAQVLDDDVFRFVLALAAGDLDVGRAFGGRGVSVGAPDGSTARVDRDGTVEWAGERDLWLRVEEIHGQWRQAGHPDRERFGLSVDGARQWAWLDAPDGPLRWERPGPA